MAQVIKLKRGTRAQLNAAASANGLATAEPYLITDENRLAVGLSASTYAEYALAGHDHGGTYQPADSDLTALAGLTTTGLIERTGDGTAGVVTKPSGAIVGTTDSQTLTNKTLTDPVISGAITEDVYTITDGAAFEIDPGNGSIQLITLGAARTPKATNFAAGESVTLMINDQATYAVTWTDSTFGSSGVKWVGGTAPTMPDGADSYLVVELWKIGTQVYGATVGEID